VVLFSSKEGLKRGRFVVSSGGGTKVGYILSYVFLRMMYVKYWMDV
jgi:hypothetical protein